MTKCDAVCAPETEPTAAPAKRPRRYTGPPKGSNEAKERMAKVRAAQYAKNGLVYDNGSTANE